MTDEQSDTKITELKDSLAQNAFDFLQYSIEQFNSKPKFSLVNFCTAIELFLKLRLLHEHWTLIIERNPNLTNFKTGDFKSINFSDLIPRIEAITNFKFRKGTKDCFQKLATHRNKIIHFSHIALSKDDEKKEIFIEELEGWDHLQKLFNEWDFLFSTYEIEIFRINHSMNQNSEFLEKKYLELKPSIEREISQGYSYTNCSRCNQRASKLDAETHYLNFCTCKVCDYRHYAFIIPCPSDSCDAQVTIEESFIHVTHKCSTCNSVVEKDYLMKVLDAEQAIIEYAHIHCDQCLPEENVIIHSDYYTCLECFSTQQEYEVCEWCNQYQIGDSLGEDSYAVGCPFCEGAVAYYMAKDD